MVLKMKKLLAIVVLCLMIKGCTTVPYEPYKITYYNDRFIIEERNAFLRKAYEWSYRECLDRGYNDLEKNVIKKTWVGNLRFGHLEEIAEYKCKGKKKVKTKKNYPLKTEYYNFAEQIGPQSVNEAISLLKKQTQLDVIEGVWINENNFTISIIKDQSRDYSIYRVADPTVTKFGFKDGTIFKGADTDYFNAQEASANDQKILCVGPVKYFLKSKDELILNSQKEDCGEFKSFFKRIWRD